MTKGEMVGNFYNAWNPRPEVEHHVSGFKNVTFATFYAVEEFDDGLYDMMTTLKSNGDSLTICDDDELKHTDEQLIALAKIGIVAFNSTMMNPRYFLPKRAHPQDSDVLRLL